MKTPGLAASPACPHAPSVSLASGTTGTFSETIGLSSYGTNASCYDGALAAETLTITGTSRRAPTPPVSLTAGPNTTTGADGRDNIFIAAAHLARIPTVRAREGDGHGGTLLGTRR